MVFLGLKLQENQKKTEENRRKPEEKKTTAPPITSYKGRNATHCGSESRGTRTAHSFSLGSRRAPYLDCAMCYMPHALLRIKSEDKKKTGALTPNQRGGALVYQTVHQPGFISLTHCGPESVPR